MPRSDDLSSSRWRSEELGRRNATLWAMLPRRLGEGFDEGRLSVPTLVAAL